VIKLTTNTVQVLPNFIDMGTTTPLVFRYMHHVGMWYHENCRYFEFLNLNLFSTPEIEIEIEIDDKCYKYLLEHQTPVFVSYF